MQASLGAGQKPVRRRCRRKAAAIEVAFQRKDDPTHVGVETSSSDQAGLTQCRQTVAQLRQPTPQASAGGITDSHVLDQLQGADSALVQIGHRLTVAVELNAVEMCRFLQQSLGTAPLAHQLQGLREPHLVVEFGEADYITTPATALAIEKGFYLVHQEA